MVVSWYGRTGQLWHTQRKAKAGEERVPAEKYTEHPNTGGLRRTGEAGSLPSLRRSSEPCVVTTKETHRGILFGGWTIATPGA